MNDISIAELIKAGAHFGHPTSRWQTSRCLHDAVKIIGDIVKKGGNILFVGTKKQAKDVVQQAADRCGMYYIVERWLGGTLTNYGTIKKSIKRLAILEKESSDIYANLTKKELNSLERERLRLADLHRGIKDMRHLPAALFFVDGLHEKIAIAEAHILGIPVFGIIDSNTNPVDIDYPIPANDDSMKTINLIVNYIADGIVEATGGSLELDVEENELKQEKEKTDAQLEVIEENIEKSSNEISDMNLVEKENEDNNEDVVENKGI